MSYEGNTGFLEVFEDPLRPPTYDRYVRAKPPAWLVEKRRRQAALRERNRAFLANKAKVDELRRLVATRSIYDERGYRR